MTISEINTVFKTYFENLGFTYIHGRRSQVNTMPIIDAAHTYPVVVLDPISYNRPAGDIQIHTRAYNINLAILDLLDIDSTSDQELATVNAMDTNAAYFINSMQDNYDNALNFDTARLSAVDVQSIFWYPDAANNLSGVILSFTIETIDTYDYCATPVLVSLNTGNRAVVGTAIVGTSTVG